MITKLFKRRNFESNFNFFAPFSFICLTVFTIFAIRAIINSPNDYQQGNAVLIMYIHVPAAWMALIIYTLMALFNIFGFIYKNPFFYLISRSIAIIGAAFTLITLITGSLWGKPIWGTYWVWDARLTSVLILFFLYLGYIILVNSFDDIRKGEKIAAVISIIGFINIPIIKFSVEYFNSLHQGASIFRKGGVAIDPAMLWPLLLMLGAYFSYFVFLSLLRVKTAILNKKIGGKMTYVVTDNCVRCKYTDCVAVCPVDCFYEGENMLVIDPDACIDCGVCVPECPAEAISPESPELLEWVEINRTYSKQWPNITKVKDPLPEAKDFDGMKDKFKNFFSKNPGKC